MLSPDSYRFMAFTPGAGGNFIAALLHEIATDESYTKAMHGNNEYKYVAHSNARLSDYKISKKSHDWLDAQTVAFYSGPIKNREKLNKQLIQKFFETSHWSRYSENNFKYRWIISHILQPGLNILVGESNREHLIDKTVLLVAKRLTYWSIFLENGDVIPPYQIDKLPKTEQFIILVENIRNTSTIGREPLLQSQVEKSTPEYTKVCGYIEWSDLLSENYKKEKWKYVTDYFGMEEHMYGKRYKENKLYFAIDKYIEENRKIIDSDGGKQIRELLEKHT